MSTTAAKLREARALIEDPERWTTREYARDAEGGALDDGAEPAAVCWCAVGALDRVTGEPVDLLHDPAYRLLAKVASYEVTRTNDRHGHAAVLRMYDRAIELAEAEA